MKILIFSDSHGDFETMCFVVDKESPDLIIHLGDGIEDTKKIIENYPEIELITNWGNVDSKEDKQWIQVKEICEKRFVMTHGHTFIKEFDAHQQTDQDRMESRIEIINFMKQNNVDIFLHGHTHEPYLNRAWIAPGKTGWIMNPGTIRKTNEGGLKATYGLIIISDSDNLECKLVEIQ